MQNAWNKYGESAFSFEILEVIHNSGDIFALRDALRDAEQRWIDKLQPYFNVYPCAGSPLGAKYSIARRQRQSEIGKALYAANPDHLRQLSASNIGRKASDETRARMSAAHIKRAAESVVSPETRAKMSVSIRAWMAARTHCKRGHPFSEANTYVTPDGRRECRACARVRSSSFYHRGRSVA
jgi:group I intron endonuclease